LSAGLAFLGFGVTAENVWRFAEDVAIYMLFEGRETSGDEFGIQTGANRFQTVLLEVTFVADTSLASVGLLGGAEEIVLGLAEPGLENSDAVLLIALSFP
jgi:hypothetical protein